MIEYALSPITFSDYTIRSLKLQFGAIANGDAHLDTTNLRVEFDIGTSFAHGDAEHTCLCRMRLRCKAQSPEDYQEIISLESSCISRGSVEEDASDEDTEETLEANAASFLYGKARTYIELLTASCPGGIISLPAIMPLRKDD